MKPESLRVTAAEASPTRVAMMVDQRSIMIKRKWYVALKKWVGMNGKCELVKPRTSQVSQEASMPRLEQGEAFYIVQQRQVGRR